MKIEYKERLYIKYLKQRLMALYGWISEDNTYKGQVWYEEGMKPYKTKLEKIKNIEELERMLFDIKQYWNISEEDARKVLNI